MKLHRAVALAFLGPKPDGYQVNHKSGDKLDNSVGNLEYVTCRENILHAWETGLCSAKHCRGENNPFAKLTAEQVREIRRLSTQMSLSQLARRFGVSKPCISGIINGKAWKHVPIEEPDVATATWMPDVIRLDDVVLSDAPAGDVVVQSS